MKTSLLLPVIVLASGILNGQDACIGEFKEYFLNSNNIRASFFPRGNKFFTGEKGAFLVPYPDSLSLSTIFASSIWLGGFDDAGNLKLAVETYPTANESDFSVGPLDVIGRPVDSLCHYDRAWSVFREEIVAHKTDYETDLDIDFHIPAIFGWPARGNAHFASIYGFELPLDNQGLAPFRDRNGNNVYDPENGDYPVVYFSTNDDFIPDQIMWMVFNDIDPGDSTGTPPLHVEIQLTAYAFHCEDNTMLNNTIFNSYKIINRAVIAIDSLYFGAWTDYDLGCFEDDFVGVDSARSTEFVYNADDEDGNNLDGCSDGLDVYPGVPPVQSMTYLNPDMHSFITTVPGFDYTPSSLYRLLSGRWEDGNTIFPHGDGHPSMPGLESTQFLFHGDPRDPTSWSANNVFDEGSDTRSLSAVSLGRCDPGRTVRIDLAYMFHHDPGTGYLDQLSVMYENVDSLIHNLTRLDQICTPFATCIVSDCVWPGDFNHDHLVDHRDLLHWGLTNQATGAERNGLISWRGHYADDWSEALPDNVNYKHSDASGNGIVDPDDLLINEDHLYFTTPYYVKNDQYPEGDDIYILSNGMNADGDIRNVRILANQVLENVHGLAFEMEFDTSFFRLPASISIHVFPSDTNMYFFNGSTYGANDNEINSLSPQYSFSLINEDELDIQDGFMFFRHLSGLSNKHNLPLDQLSDTVVIRLKNLIALDAEGNDLHLGAITLKVPNYNLVTAVYQPQESEVALFPNPVNHSLHVMTEKPEPAQIYNVIGSLVMSIPANALTEPINVQALPAGIYFLQLPDSGRTVRFVKN